jgi:alkylation response protein AidB-like acyl-CoA dehydrogenase
MDHAGLARAFADDVLFPRAAATDAADLVPADLLDALAAEGFYGMAAPVRAGGWELDRAGCDRVIEALAGGCLTTTFVWIQHHNVVRAVDASPLRDAWLGRLASGEVRAGIARAAERPGTPILTARPDGADWVLDGEAPWVTGWGRIDVLLVGARHEDEVVRVLLDARDVPGLTRSPLSLVATNASGTVTARFDGVRVPGDRLVEREPAAEAFARDPVGLRTNGSLALGVAGRCARLARQPEVGARLATAVDAARVRLDAAGPDDLPAARAEAADLSWRAAGALVADHGSRSVLAGDHPERLAREALFVLVFGTRAAIRDELLGRLPRPSP